MLQTHRKKMYRLPQRPLVVALKQYFNNIATLLAYIKKFNLSQAPFLYVTEN